MPEIEDENVTGHLFRKVFDNGENSKMKTDKISVSVIFITYNHEKYIKQSLESVINQIADFNFEIVIGEDHSSDNTYGIIKEYQKKYPELIKIRRSESNVGLLKNYKLTAEACQGKYLAGISGDDYWIDQYKLQKQFDFLEENPDFGLCYTDLSILDTRNNKLIESNYSNFDKNITIENQYEELLITNYISPITVCMRSSLLYDYFNFVGKDYYRFQVEDKPVWLYAAHHSKFYFLNEITAVYRRIPGSVTHNTDLNKLLETWNSYYEISDYFIERFGCKEETKSKLALGRNRNLFNIASRIHKNELGINSYKYLKEHGSLKKLDKLKYFIMQNLFLLSAFNGIIFAKRQLRKLINKI